MRRIAFGTCLLVVVTGSSFGQQNQPPLPQPRLMTIFPHGGKAGSSVEVSFTGTDLEEPEALLFSHPGLRAEPIIPPTPPAPPVDPKKKPAVPPMPPVKPPITKFKVAIAANVPPGLHDVRLVNRWGVSNPRPFVVGTLNENEEKEPNNDVAQAQRTDINTTVNGAVSSPTDVDYYVFSGQKGQRVLLYVAATSIDSRGKPALEVYDAEGNRLLFSRNYRDYDALGDVTLPADGDYWVRLFNFTHTAGSAEHYYRLTLTTGPWIDAVVPPMVEPGKTAQVTLFGRNLPGGQPVPAHVDGRPLEKLVVSITAPTDPLAQQRLQYSGRLDPLVSALDGFEYRFRGPTGVSNPYLLTFAKAPVAIENEGNDQPEQAQALSLPCEVAGRLEKRADRDWYLLTVKKGDVFNIELFADRLGAAGDFYFMLKPADPKAGVLAEQEDTTDSLHPFQFFTRTFDPLPYRFEAAQDGKYWLLVCSRDAGTTYGPQSLYRLRITKEQPDFRLIVMPASNNRPDATVLRAGGEQLFDVFVWRQQGFVAPVALTVEGLPAGVTYTPQTVSPTQRQGTLVLSAAANAAVANSVLTIKGTATVAGSTLVREARPATISWPTPQGQNSPTVSRLDRQLFLAVRDKAPFRLTAETERITAKQGDKINLKLKLARLWPDLKAVVNVQAVTITGNQPLIAGIVFNNNQPLAIAADKNDGSGTLTIAQNVAPGTYTVVLRGAAQFQFGKTATDKKQPVGLVQPSTPITVTVVPASLGRISAILTKPNLKPGETGQLVVKIERQHNFVGEYKIKVVLPPNAQGIAIENGVVAAGKDEVKLPIIVAKDAKPVSLQNIVVQAVALFDPNTPISQETKLNGLNVVK